MSSFTMENFDRMVAMLPKKEDIFKAIVVPIRQAHIPTLGTMLKIQDTDGFYLVMNKADLDAVIGVWRGVLIIESDEKYGELIEKVIERFKYSLIKPIEWEKDE